MKPKVIKTEAQYEATLARIERIFDAKPGTAKGDELELLVLLVEAYEDSAYPIDLPDLIAALRFRMDRRGSNPRTSFPTSAAKTRFRKC